MSQSALEQLKVWTTVVVDSSDFEAFKEFKAQDATTNPSLVLQATQKPAYAQLIKQAILKGKQRAKNEKNTLESILDQILVSFGCEILKIVPGRVSTEVDARLSFNKEASIAKARELIALYQEAGIPKERVLIKLASTWEGLMAAETLEKEGIHCNMTLIFHKIQAIRASEIGATLVSPFVGRILDWYKKNENFTGPASQDPGVLSVKEIYALFTQHNIPTIVMGASFRNIDEIIELAGCQYLTISPALLQELSNTIKPLERKLTPPAKTTAWSAPRMTEAQFRWELNESPMATDKLAEGIRNFAKDTVKLEAWLMAQS
jgi:transaldolase